MEFHIPLSVWKCLYKSKPFSFNRQNYSNTITMNLEKEPYRWTKIILLFRLESCFKDIRLKIDDESFMNYRVMQNILTAVNAFHDRVLVIGKHQNFQLAESRASNKGTSKKLFTIFFFFLISTLPYSGSPQRVLALHFPTPQCPLSLLQPPAHPPSLRRILPLSYPGT